MLQKLILFFQSILAIATFTSCNHDAPKRIKVNDVDSITYFMMRRDIELLNGIHSIDRLIEKSKDESYPFCQDSTVSDRRSIIKFVRIINSLKQESENRSVDFRTAARIHMKNGHDRDVCCGAHWGITLDLVIMKDNATFFQYIDEEIYGVHPAEYWMDDWFKRLVKGEFDHDL